MSAPPRRPDGRRATPAWYRETGLSIAFEAGVSCVISTRGQPQVRLCYDGGYLELPNPTSHRRLYRFACGCGHIALGHPGGPSRHRELNRAEQWAIGALRRHGLDIPRESKVPERPGTRAVQEGRRAAAKRCRAIAVELAFEAGVKEIVYDRRSISGRAHYAERRIRVPDPTTRRRLYVFAHECGHIAMGHVHGCRPHREEYEAERWAIDALRRHHVAVPRKELRAAKRYVANWIRQDIQRGMEPAAIDREAMRFAGVKVRDLKECASSRP